MAGCGARWEQARPSLHALCLRNPAPFTDDETQSGLLVRLLSCLSTLTHFLYWIQLSQYVFCLRSDGRALLGAGECINTDAHFQPESLSL